MERIIESDLQQLACKLFDDRRRRDRLFNGGLFGEPAWDMLLALYGQSAEWMSENTSWFARSTNVPLTTAARWQGALLKQGLIEPGPEGALLCKKRIQLTGKARVLMEQCLFESGHYYDQTPAQGPSRG